MSSIERRQKDRVLRALERHLVACGFTRTRPSWFVRIHSGMAEFIHVHKFTFGPHFRVHAGRRDLSDRSESVALNGPDSDEIRDWRYLLVPTRKYDLTYASDADSVERCAQGMYDFCVKVAERWFQKNRDRSACKDAEPSPATTELLGLDRIAQAKNRRPS